MYFIVDKDHELPIAALTADLAAKIQATLKDSEIVEATSLAEAKRLFPEYFKHSVEEMRAEAIANRPFVDKKRLRRISMMKDSMNRNIQRLLDKDKP